jgi:hypothetical protein
LTTGLSGAPGRQEHCTPLHIAAKNNNTYFALLLVAAKANVNAQNKVSMMVEAGRWRW